MNAPEPGCYCVHSRLLVDRCKECELDRLKAVFLRYAEWHGGCHEMDCPEDDTCDCKGKEINDLVNDALKEQK